MKPAPGGGHFSAGGGHFLLGGDILALVGDILDNFGAKKGLDAIILMLKKGPWGTILVLKRVLVYLFCNMRNVRMGSIPTPPIVG